MSDSTKTQIENIRQAVGVSRPSWIQLLGASSETALRGDAMLAAAKDVQRAHSRFIRKMIANVAAEFETPIVVDDVEYITTAQVSRALGLGEFHVSALRDRGKLQAVRYGRRTLFSREAVMDLVTRGIEPRTQHAPLAPRFVETYLAKQAS